MNAPREWDSLGIPKFTHDEITLAAAEVRETISQETLQGLLREQEGIAAHAIAQDHPELDPRPSTAFATGFYLALIVARSQGLLARRIGSADG